MKKEVQRKDMDIVEIGIGLILLGFAVVVIGMLFQSNFGQKSETDSKVAFVGFIGPIPFGFGNDRGWMMMGMVIATAILFLAMVLFKGAK